MKDLVKSLLRKSVRTASALRVLGPRSNGARIITYHSVRPVNGEPKSSYVLPQELDRQLAWLVQNGYEIVSLSQLVEAIEHQGPISPKWIAVTFDDGYADNYHHAYPILRKYKVPATIFLITGKINTEGFLSLPQISDMALNQIEFGAHTVDHVSLTSVSPEAAREQITRSQEDLQQITGSPVEHFCYPFGHFNSTIEAIMIETKFRSCCVENAGPITPKTPPSRLTRVGVLGTDTLQDFRLKILGGYDWWINLYLKLTHR